MDFPTWSATFSTPSTSEYFAACEQSKWDHGAQYAAVPGWEIFHADLNPLNPYPNSKLLDAGTGRHAYQSSLDVLSAASYTDPSFFTAEKCSELSGAPPALSPSPPSLSTPSSSSSVSPSNSLTSSSGAMSPVGAGNTSFPFADSPTDPRPISSPSSPDSPPAPLNYARERRRAQNRKAQQTHRERRAQRVKHLESRVQELEALENVLRAENGELKEELMRVEGMMRTVQLCRDAGQTMGFPNPVAMWNSIQRHPLVAAGGVDVALVCEELRSLASGRHHKALLFDTRQVNEVIEKCRSRQGPD